MTRSIPEPRRAGHSGGDAAAVPIAPAAFLDPEEIFRTLDLAGKRRIALAVSGGGDSMALLVAAHSWSRTRTDVELLALTVDHALRSASAAEAADVAAFCAARGIAHRTLVWSAPKPASGISAAARQARHALLAQAALEAETDIVLTGHTFDDQAETVAMRSLRASGRGEAGMAPATLFDNAVWFVRPLLTTRRETLRGFLRSQGIDWAEDPSNTDMRYERVRLRTSLGEAERDAAMARAARAAYSREEAGREAATIIATEASCPAPGLIRLGAGLVNREVQAALYALRIILAVVGGRTHLVEEESAAELLERLSGTERMRATLSRCVVDRRGGSIFLHREARGLPETEIGDSPVEWDGRYRITREQGHGRFVVGPAGDEASGVEVADPSVPRALARAAGRAEPLCRHCGSALSCVRLVSPWARHLPSFDLAPALAAARLIGAPEIPPLPLARHNRVI